MLYRSTSRFNTQLYIIHPGEYYVTREKAVIATLLGSCISACLIDKENGIYGMNHFMLPGKENNNTNIESNIFHIRGGMYGINAMELLINDMMKRGADRRHLSAKIFGGGSMITNKNVAKRNIPYGNIEFIKDFLKMESIPILSEDLGGDHGRKIYFFTDTGKVLLKRIFNEKVETRIEKEEKKYETKLLQEEETKKEAGMFIFDHNFKVDNDGK